MEYTVKSKYLVFPVNGLSSKKKLSFRKDGQTLYALEIRLDPRNPYFYAYIDVSRFMGQTLTVSIEPEMALSFTEAEEMNIEGLYREPMRPQVHFTTKNGWMNDPNGLIYLDGVYHMFYQHNPAEELWGNMHWGHAVSQDLIHWEEKDIALFPDDRGAMFSGSAVLDKQNLLGRNRGETPAALLYYTTTDPFCQHLSYSVDGFKTIHRYSDDPVIPHIAGDNRDPKVIFCEEMGCYILALYLEEDRYCLFRTADLSHWESFQEFRLPGDNECPDIFPLRTEDGERKWVIIGAHDKYLVGQFLGGQFVPQQPIQPLHYGPSGYAGQTFSNLPGGRTVRMVWDRWQLPAYRINGQMGIPMELSLSRADERYYLQANPIREVETLYQDTKIFRNVPLSSEESFRMPLDSCAHLVKLSAALQTGKLKARIFGIKIEFDLEENRMQLGDCSAPISVTGEDLDVTMIVDRCSVELFANKGKVFLSCLDKHTFSDYNLPSFSLEATEAISLTALEIHPLESIWEG